MCNTLGWDDLWNPKLSPLGSQEPLCWAQPDLKPHCLDNLQLVIPVTLESENPSHEPRPGPSFATSSEFNKSILSSNSKIFFFPFFQYPELFSRSGVPNLQDLMPDDLRWNWYKNNRNKEHNECKVLESSRNHSSWHQFMGKLFSMKLAPGAKGWGPLF